MKPYKTLLILLVFMVLLYGPSLFHFENIHPGGFVSINLPQIDDLLDPPGGNYDLPNNIPELEDTVSGDILMDSSVYNIKIFPAIEYPDSSGIYSSLLEYLTKEEVQTRILYYGDSQMEGDRITDFLRQELRQSHGGTGPGLLSPTMLVPYTRTAYIRASPNWKSYNYLSYKNGEIDHTDLGPLLSFSRFEGAQDEETEAWIKVSPSTSADSLSRVYNSLSVLYGKLNDSLHIEIIEGKRSVYKGWLNPVEEIAEFRYSLNSPASLEIRFSGVSSPDLYAISLESDSGIILDNIPLRGSAGLEFAAAGTDNLRSAYNILDPDLIILHFGLNVVLNIRDDYSYYENHLYRQIEYLKSLYPLANYLLIGVGDMARKDESGIHSYPNIPLIIEAQRRAAIRSEIMFWDSWQAMGGMDAIVNWRNKTPPLASNDYTHISYAGGHKIGAYLFDALAADRMVNIDDSIEAQTVVNFTDTLLLETGNTYINILKSYTPDKPLIFTSVGFWIFMLVLLILYSLVFDKPLIRNTYLFLFSLFFYFKSGGVFFALLIISTITDYVAAWMIHISDRKPAKKFWVLISLLVNLGMLGYFKYTAFITGIVNDVFGLNIPVQDWLAMISNNYLGTGFNIASIVLPVGISFFTFQTISYTIDVYRKKTQPVRNILDFGFYVSFFPQLVAGPIVRASEFIPQLYQKFTISKREWSHALYLIVSGLIKKVIVSDYIAVNFIDNIFASPGAHSGLENLVAVYGYGLQIYCDFSGYTDIAIGVALMLGFRLPVNFNSPYKAQNITDFWRRWHISLSRWLKDYLYISMGGNRKGRFRTSVNLFITMLLGGLWHGAAWKFIIWGGLHGSGLILHKLWLRIFPQQGRQSIFSRFVAIFITFNFVSFCWIFFRADGISEVGLILERIFSHFSPGDIPAFFKSYSNVLVVIVAGYILHFLPVAVKESYRGLFIKIPLVFKIVLVYLLAIALYNIQSIDFQPFIYFRF